MTPRSRGRQAVPILVYPPSQPSFVGGSAGPGGATLSISHTLKDYLDREYAQYDVLPHPEAFRAAVVAQAFHTPEMELAKVVILKVNERFVMTVLPASWQVDLHRLRTVLAAHQDGS